MNRSTELWSMPWHARLKDLADNLRGESAVTAALAARRLTARKPTARIVAGPAGSWLNRARRQAMPMQRAGS